MRKIFFLSLFILILFLLFLPRDFSLAAAKTCDTDANCPRGQTCSVDPCGGTEKTCGRALEICYPKIPGLPVPKTVAFGLPEYANYIFRFSIIVIGFVIFGVLVYSGVRYLTSAGDPAKMGDAKEGILAAFLGAVILLSAYLIFNTINPQLTILELPPVELLAAVVTPGAYICNYEYKPDPGEPSIETIFNDYIQKGPKQNFDAEKQKEAAKKLRKIMVKSETQRCPRVSFSGNFEGDFKVTENNTMFIIPTIQIIDNERVPFYEYGIVLHEKDDQRGKCKGYAKEDPTGLIYTRENDVPYTEHQFDGYKPTGLGFDARSVTVFQKPAKEPSADAKAIILYTCLDRNRISCPDGVSPAEKAFPTGGYDIFTYYDLGSYTDNTRSIDIKPMGSFFALLYDNLDRMQGNCAVVKTFRANTMGIPIDTVGECKWWQQFNPLNWFRSEECRSAIKSMIVIKGTVL